MAAKKKKGGKRGKRPTGAAAAAELRLGNPGLGRTRGGKAAAKRAAKAVAGKTVDTV